MLAALRRGRRRARAAVAPTTPDDRLAAIGAPRAGLRLHGLGHRDDRRARRAVDGVAGDPAGPREGAQPRCPVAVGFGIATPEQAAAAADAGADGVIVGSRLVRAAAEADEPADPRRGAASWSRRSPPALQR